MRSKASAPRRGVSAWLCAALLAGAPLAHASHIGDDEALDQQAVSSSDQLLDALRRFDGAAVEQRSAALQRLTQLAAQRRERLLALLERNPKAAALRLLPAPLRARMPAQAQGLIEQDLSASGSVHARIEDDPARGRSSQKFFFESAAGERFELHLADGGERDLLSWAGKRMSLAGTRLDGHLLVKKRADVQLEAAGGSSTGSGTLAAATLQGDQKTLSILLNFNDAALSCSATDIASRLFGASGATVNNGFRESSRGLVSFSGNAVGPFTIPYSASGSCDYSGWANAANAAAKAAGFDPALYQRVNYVTPSNGTCGWSGLAYMPGKQSWVQACGATGVFAHELGHNLSLHHASANGAEYGDYSDPMGGARMVQSNGANRSMAGWMPAGSVLDVSTGSSYALSAIEGAGNGNPQLLRIFKPDSNEWYYLSLRQPVGIDASLGATYLNTLSIHRATGTLPTRTYLLQNLAVGQTFTDSVNGIQVTHQTLSGDTSTVAVSMNGGSCTRQAPGVAISPASQSGAAGTTFGYTVTVTNRNSSACGSGSFALAQTLPAGFGGGFGSGSLSIAAGASASTTWSVTSAGTLADATYTLDARATDSAASASSTVGHASAVIFGGGGGDTTPPNVAIASPAAGASVSGKVVIAANASDNASGIARVDFYIDGTLLGSRSAVPYTINWNSRRAAKGVRQIKARALDGAGNAAEQTISVTVN